MTMVAPPAGLADAPANLRGVRLAHAPRQFLDQVEPDVASRFHAALTLLREAGADIVEIDLGDDFGALSRTATWSIFLYETMGAVSGFLRDHDVPITFEAIVDGLKPGLQSAWRAMVLPGGPGAISTEAYQEALTVTRPVIRRRLDAVFAEHGAHAMIQPTTPCPAPLIEEQARFHIGERAVNDLALADHTLVASLSGLPGISLPAGRSPLGLPIGLELDAPADNDPALLALARRVETIWAGRFD
jgi:indoleacetamide hydrolase